jgi:protein TonB
VTALVGDILERVEPAYPVAARRRGQEGEVVLIAFVADDGTVRAVEVERSSSVALLDGAARRALAQWRFRPGLGPKVRVSVLFRLEEN